MSFVPVGDATDAPQRLMSYGEMMSNIDRLNAMKKQQQLKSIDDAHEHSVGVGAAVGPNVMGAQPIFDRAQVVEAGRHAGPAVQEQRMPAMSVDAFDRQAALARAQKEIAEAKAKGAVSLAPDKSERYDVGQKR